MQINISSEVALKLDREFNSKQKNNIERLLSAFRSEALPSRAYKLFPNGMVVLRIADIRVIGVKKKSVFWVHKVLRTSDVQLLLKDLPLKPISITETVVPGKQSLDAGKILYGKKKGTRSRTDVSGRYAHKSVKRGGFVSPQKITRRKVNPKLRKRLNDIFGGAVAGLIAKYILTQGISGLMELFRVLRG